MGRMGHGYGSEWQLLRFMGRHRKQFDDRVRAVTGAGSVRWLDFPYGTGTQDMEWKGLDFLPDSEVRTEWGTFWPQTGNVQNWDAVGQIRDSQESSWLLVEAKSHEAEMQSSCGAKGEGRRKIQAALAATKAAMGVPAEADWENGYYQYANRLATLHFLTIQGVSAQLLFVYFVGDVFPDGPIGPKTVREWNDALSERDHLLGLTAENPLRRYIRHLFLDVTGRDIAPPRRRGRCPDCRARDFVPIIIGYPSEDSFEEAQDGKVVIGGCIPFNGDQWGLSAVWSRVGK